uniref:Transposable element P transposase n=1 Tax=Anopheles funestus TaxID=62324 RepID=A0A182S093_ANOFN
MKVESVLEYDPAADEIIGPHNYVQVVMARGLFKNWKQPVFIGFDKSMTKELILEIIKKMSEKNINVVAIVDNCPANTSCWKELGAGDYKSPYFLYPITKKHVYVVPDVPHLLKLTRNWLLDHGFNYKGKKIVSKPLFDVMQDRIAAEMTSIFKICKGHLILSSQEKQNVRKAAQLLSRTVAISLRRYVHNETSQELANFIEKVDLWFSVSCSYTPLAKEHYKISYNGNENQIKALQDMYELMQNSIVIGKSSLQTFQKSILMQITSLQMLFEDMQQTTYKLNQDLLENFFSQIRQRGGVYDHPTPLSFIYRARVMILGKSPTILHNQTDAEQRNKITTDEYLTSAGAYITPNLPDMLSIEEVNGLFTTENSDLESDYSDLDLGIRTYQDFNEHSYCQPPTFVDHISLGGLFKPSSNFLNLGHKMEKIFQKLNPNGSLHKKPGIVKRLAATIHRQVNLPLEIIKSFAKQWVIVRMRYLNLKSNEEATRKRRTQQKDPTNMQQHHSQE